MSGAARSALRTIFGGVRELLRVRWVRIVAILAVLALGVRFGGEWAVGRTIKSLTRDVGIECAWEALDVSLLDGRGEVRFLSFTPVDEEGEPTAAPLVELEYAIFDLDVRALLGGRISVRRAEVDGLDTRLEREADGTWNIEKHVDVAQVLSVLEGQGAADETEAAEETEETGAIRLSPPVAIDALRIQHARLHLVDRAVTPELDEVLEANVRLSNVGAVDRRVRFTVTVTGGELLDGATLDGAATWEPSKVALELKAHAGSFRPGPLAPYLALVWVEPRAESIEAEVDMAIELEVIGEAQDTLRGKVAMRDLGLAADGEAAMRMENAWIELERASSEGATLPRIAIDGVSGGATLDASGALELGGFALLPRPPAAKPAPSANGTSQQNWAELMASWAALWDPASYPSWAALFARSDPNAYPWSIGELTVTGVSLALQDETFEPAAELAFAVDAFALGPIVHDPAFERAPIPMSAKMRAPGIAESIVVEGTLAPFAPERGLDLTLTAEGIGLDAVGPYLNRAGVEDVLDGGSLRGHLVALATTDENGRTEGWIELEELALTGADDLFGVRSMAARELVLDPAEGLMRLGDVEIAGPRLFLARDPSSGFLAFGLRTIGRSAVDPGPPSSADPSASSTTNASEAPGSTSEVAADDSSAAPARELPIPRLEIGRLAWIDTDLSFVDDSIDPPGRITVDEMGFELTGLTVGGDPNGPEHEPARFSARFVAGDLAEEMRLEGTIRSKPGTIDLAAELTAQGQGLRGRLLVPYLRELGLEPALESGRVSGSLSATLREEQGGWLAGLSARDMQLADGDEPLLGVGELDLEEVRVDEAGLTVGRVSVVRPFAHVMLEPGGAVRAAGVRLLAPEEPSAVDPVAQAATVAEAAPPAPLALPALPAGSVGTIAVSEARLRVTDASTVKSLDEAIELELVSDVEVGTLDLSGSETTTFRVGLGLAGVIETIDVEGALQLAPERWTFEAGVTGQGLTAQALVPYLPPVLRPAESPSTFQGRFAAKLEGHAEGGLSASFGATELGFWNGESTEPLASVASASAFVGRLDPVAGRIVLDAVRTEGVELAVRRDESGAVHAMGFVLDPSAAPLDDEAAVEAGADGEGEANGANVRTPRSAPPRVEIAGGIDVGVDRLVFRDESLGADARPVEASFGLLLDGPCVLLDADPRELPPIALELSAAVNGLFDADVGVRAAPFADPATVQVELDAHDVRTQGLAELVPELATLVQGETERGLATSQLAVELDVRRRAPYDLGLDRAFGLDVRLEGTDYFDQPDGRSYAGVDQVLIEGRVDPGRGIVQLKTVDVRNPHGFVRRDDEGIHALGLLVALPAAEEVAAEPGEPAEDDPAADPAAEDASTPATDARAVQASLERDEPSSVQEAAVNGEPEVAASSEEPSGEFRIDELLVSDIDFEIVDATAEPNLRIPLSGLDAELKRFTTRMFNEPRPVSFSAYLSADGDGPEAPPVFGEVALSGRVAVTPEPKGWAQVNLEGLELTPFAGLAGEQNLTIEDGALDANVRVRIKGATSGKVNASFVFSDLDMAEPGGGVVERVLSLPASLDAVLFLLRNQNGEHKFSVGFPVSDEGLKMSSLALAAAGATTEVIARAVAGAPLRLVGGLIPGSNEPKEEPAAVWSMAYEPGALEPNLEREAQAEVLAELAQRLNARGSLVASLRHEMAAVDLEQAAVLANPSAEECLEFAAGLRQRKAELLRSHEELATEIRTLFPIGRDDDALTAIDELRELERTLLATEQSLDQVLGILRRDSPRQQDKRTRAAARELAEERLSRARDDLARGISKDALDRIDVRSPRGRVVEGLETSRIVIELREK